LAFPEYLPKFVRIHCEGEAWTWLQILLYWQSHVFRAKVLGRFFSQAPIVTPESLIRAMRIGSSKKTLQSSKYLVLICLWQLCTWTIACSGPGQSVERTQNPLVAQYTLTTPCSGQFAVEFGPDTSYGRTTSPFAIAGFSSGTSIYVAGMKASTTYHMRSQVQCNNGRTETTDDLTFKTGPLPGTPFPTIAVSRPNPSSESPENPGIEMIDVISPNDNYVQALFTDRDGNPIWYYPMEPNFSPETIKFLPNGGLIFSLVNGSDSRLREVDLGGNTIRELDITDLQQRAQSAGMDFVPINLHHDVLPLANGHLIVLVNFGKDFTDLPGYPGTIQVVGDGLIDLDENWNPVWSWNSFDHLDVNRHLNGLPDWTHSNAIVYTQDGNLLLSMRHQSWILKIDYNNGMGTGNILWRLGYQGDFALTMQGAPTDDPGLWFSYQHFPSIVSQDSTQTTMAIWDNGDNRVVDNDGNICQSTASGSIPACYSRATVFKIDENARVSDLLWADPLQYFGVWGGSINQLSNGNVEFDANAPLVPPSPDVASVIQEVTQTDNPQVVWQMEISPINQNAYRAYRVPSLYPGVTWAQ
jgi:arylsulfate sulfotransferase